MDKARYYLSQRAVRASVAVAASALLVAGATWHGLAANTSATSQPAAQAALAAQGAPGGSSRVLAGGRDSYADVVKMVAPGVVTIRVEGQARVAPTGFGEPGQFGEDQDDMLRRFFDQFGQQFGQSGRPGQPGQRGQRMPRTFKQRGLGSGVVVT